MELALLFFQRHLYGQSVLLADEALKTMLQAVYIKINETLPPPQLSVESLIQHVRSYVKLDLDSELFLINVHLFFCSEYDRSAYLPAMESVSKVLIKVDTILYRMSLMTAGECEGGYCSVFQLPCLPLPHSEDSP
ncbi:hypothetical protein [Paenibacillus tyrfis]|uniref:hypothetical protein n=1 Tax=Paenibacillus tyrfis TaxID=1501230 RepID=UPI00209EE770|nr:hypothetical protein [Paenibacillus tyrfis]MCP1307988.1 hypothetical protein [Paenibacillus tyrfis]